MNTFLYVVFVSPHGGLGGPPSFLDDNKHITFNFALEYAI
jgi:hypothetical protein